MKFTSDSIKSSYLAFSKLAFHRSSFSENTQQIYKRTPMLKCDFNKVAKQVLSL